VSTKIADTIAAVEAAVLATYCRTSRAGVRTCTVASGWTTTGGNVSAITLTNGTESKTEKPGPSELVGSHLLIGTTARRITASARATNAGVVALTTSAWSSAPTAGAATICDGFRLASDLSRLADVPQDRLAQVVVEIPRRDPAWGVQGTGRWVVTFAIQVAYLYAYDWQADGKRVAEDIEALSNKVLEEATQPAGVVILLAEPGATFDPIDDQDGTPLGVIVTIPFTVQYAGTSVEA